MSDTPKRPYAEVVKIAEALKERLTPFCERLELAGSLRRRKPMIGDIELVAIPKFEERVVTPAGLFQEAKTERVHLLKEYLDGLMAEGKISHTPQKAWGDRYSRFLVQSKQGHEYKVDLFMPRPENWGVIFLIRTGSAEFSEWMVTEGHKGGPLPAGYRVAGGELLLNEVVVPCPEEEVYFEVVGIPFVDPAERTAEWVKAAKNLAKVG